jgi:hypothetical protein
MSKCDVLGEPFILYIFHKSHKYTVSLPMQTVTLTTSLLPQISCVWFVASARHPPWPCFFFYWWGGTRSLGTAATSGLLYKPQMIEDDDCGAIGGMKIGRGNRSTRRKPAPAPLCPPQIPHDQTRAPTPGLRGGKPATNLLSYGAAFPDLVPIETFLIQLISKSGNPTLLRI